MVLSEEVLKVDEHMPDGASGQEEDPEDLEETKQMM